MTQTPKPVALSGGLDLISAGIAMPAGRVRGGVNHEPLSTGYARVQGYERFDGRPEPSGAAFYRADFTNGGGDLVADQTVVGVSSGAFARILVPPSIASGDLEFGDAAGELVLGDIGGSFIVGETLRVGANPVAVLASAPVSGAVEGADEYYDLLARAQDSLRENIEPIPGSGPVRGGGELFGIVYAFRDNIGGTAGAMYRATATGWQAVDLGREIDFHSGVDDDFVEGDIITGLASGATATVRRIVKTGGSWGSDAAGFLVIAGQSGTFQASEALQVAGVTKVTASGDSAAITLPPGGRYICKAHNFYGAANLRRMYGVNGVGKGFEFDGAVFTPIRTDMAVDVPKKLFIYQNHLFLAFAGGSLQNSAPGEPLIWDAVLGVDEIGLGTDITDGIEASATALVIFGTNKVAVLTGTDQDTFAVQELTHEAGAEEFTAQKVGAAVYLDRQGLRTVSATQDFGNFRAGTLTELIWPFLNQRFEAGQRPVGSVISKAKTHYRLFWSDGVGLHIYTGGKAPEALPVQVDFTPTCLFNAEMADGSEGIFAGAADGFLYRLDRGTSFDGEGVRGYLRLPFNRCGLAMQEKRFHRLQFEMFTAGRARLAMSAEFGPGEPYPMTGRYDFTAYGLGGVWDVSNWDEFIWDAGDETVVFGHVDGQALGIAPLIICDNRPTDDPYVLQAYTPNFSPRKVVR